MARKNEESNAAVIDLPPIEPKTLMLSAMIELDVTDHADTSGHTTRAFNFSVSEPLAKRFRILWQTLKGTHATFNGTGCEKFHVDSYADAFRWLLDQIVLEKQESQQ